jgi:hypothetical protein
MKKHIQIKDSYKIWKQRDMWRLIFEAFGQIVNVKHFTAIKIEWWLHNIGYWLTRPFISIGWVKKLNERFKHVDLMVEVGDDLN